MRVVAIREDVPAVPQRAMRGTRHSNREPLHTSRKGALVFGLDDQVQVIGLDREVHDAKGVLLASRDRVAHRLEEQPIAPQARQPFASPHRDVHRMTGNMPLAASVRHTNAAAQRFATSTRPSTAMREDGPKRKLLLDKAIAHLD
jgi:hypothetical protein